MTLVFPLTYNGDVKKLTSPQVIHIKIRETQVEHSYGLRAYYILQLSKSSVIYSLADTVSKLQKGDVRWGHSN